MGSRWQLALLALLGGAFTALLLVPGGRQPLALETAAEAEAESAPAVTPAPPTTRAAMATATAPAATQGMRVRVWNAATGAPVAGVDVLRLQPRTLSATARWELLGPHGTKAALWQRFGAVARTDREGLAHFPDAGEGLLWCQHQGLAAEQFVTAAAAAAEVALTLTPSTPLLVRVEDGTGQPVADVPVVVRARIGNRVVDLITAWTGPGAGTARLEDVSQTLLRQPEGTQPYVTLGVPLAAPPQVPVSPAALPQAPMRLELPPCGVLEVDVPDAGDAATPRVLGLRCSPSDQPSEHSESEPFVYFPLPSGEQRLVIPHVGLGIWIWLRLQAPGTSALRELVVRGPARPGQRVTAVLPPPDARLLLAGTLRDGAAALGQVRVTAVLGEDPAAQQSLQCQTAANGDFEVSATPPAGDALRLWLICRSGGQWLTMTRRVALRSGLTRLDLGTLTLQPTQPAIAGRVIDQANRPADGARVTLWRGAHAVASCQVGADGAFEFVAEATPTASLWQVQVTRSGWITPAPVPVAPGTRDLVVRLARGAEVVGSVRLDPDGIGAAARWQLCRDPAPDPLPAAHALAWHSARTDPNGQFRFAGVASGRHVVRAVVGDDALPVWQIGDVTVGDGGTTADPRLQDVDLTSLVAMGAVDVRSSEGRILTEAQGHLEYDTTRVLPATLAHGGRIQFVAPRLGATRLVVEAPGYRPVAIPVASGNRTVVLPPGVPIMVRHAAPAAPARLQLNWRAARAPDPQDLRRFARVPSLRLACGETSALALPGPGCYRLTIQGDALPACSQELQIPADGAHLMVAQGASGRLELVPTEAATTDR